MGTGQRSTVCLSYCDGFYSACADEYFAFHPTSGMAVTSIMTTCHRMAGFTDAQGPSSKIHVAKRRSMTACRGLCAGTLTPCATSGQQPALVCSRGRDLAASPAELCSLSGALPGDDASLCWSGGDTPAVLDSCKGKLHSTRDTSPVRQRPAAVEVQARRHSIWR